MNTTTRHKLTLTPPSQPIERRGVLATFLSAENDAEIEARADTAVPRRDSGTVSPGRCKYATISGWREMTGMSRTGIYEAIGRGDLRAIKLGTRTLIDVEHGLAWMASLPAAQIVAPKSGQ